MVPRIRTDTQMCTPSLTYSIRLFSLIDDKGHDSVYPTLPAQGVGYRSRGP